MKTEKQEKKKTKYVTDTNDVLQFGISLGGSWYTNGNYQSKYMKSYSSSMIVNGKKLIND
tara:strand:- start:11006 stop:11185 length:180 start_codon:yes stop_codon:yes gene_type:complete